MKKLYKIIIGVIICITSISKNVQADVIMPGQELKRKIENVGENDVIIGVIAAIIIAITAFIVIKLINNSKKN